MMRRSQQGFTIIEVLIAAFIIAIVLGAAGFALQSALGGQSRAKMDSRGRTVTATVIKKMQANSSWISQCRSTPVNGQCVIPITSILTEKDRLLVEPDGTVTHTLRVVVTPIDLPADGTGPADTDTQLHDVYRIAVTDTVKGPMYVDEGKSFRSEGTVNPAVRGVHGSVRVRMCAVQPQVDERLGTGLCAQGKTAASFRTQSLAPPLASSCSTTRAAQIVCEAWNAAEADDNSLSERYTSVTLAPMRGARVSITGPLSSNSPTTRTLTMNSGGSADVNELIPGQYRITTPGIVNWDGGRWVAWSSHSVPSSGHLIVEKGAQREATLLMRPAQPTVRLTVDTSDRTNPLASPVIRSGASFVQTIRLMPVPTDRSQLERGTSQNGWTTIRPGNTTVTLADAAPGLYSIHVMHYPSGLVSRLQGTQRYIWINANGTTVPSTLRLRQDYCDVTRRHTDYVVPQCRAAGTRWCWVGSGAGARFVGECNDNPVDSGGASTGAGGA